MKPSLNRIECGLYWDRAWSLVEGCTPVSAACDNCWAAKSAHMRRNHPNIHISMDNSGITNECGKFNGAVRFRHDLLDLPLTVKNPTVWAVWTDLFHEKVNDEFIKSAFVTMALAGKHTFLVLTKRAKRLHRILNSNKGYPANICLGVTVENQQAAEERIPLLLQTPAAKRFISVEPMLGPVDFREYLAPSYCSQCGRDIKGGKACGPTHALLAEGNWIEWVICGGETGPNARPMHPDWARSLRDQCKAAGVPFWFKGWGAHIPNGQEKGKLDGEVIREFPE